MILFIYISWRYLIKMEKNYKTKKEKQDNFRETFYK